VPSEPTAEALGIQTDGPLPAKRSPDPIRADEDTLYRELSAVVDRHNGDIDHATLVRALFDYADTYAELYDIDRHVEFRSAPERATADELPVVIVPAAAEPLAPINFELEDKTA
jgi:hypothetical protein